PQRYGAVIGLSGALIENGSSRALALGYLFGATLVIGAAVMMGLQPRLTRWLAARRANVVTASAAPQTADGATAEPATTDTAAPDRVGFGAWLATFLTGVYGGYFGAAQGIILITALAILLPDDLRRTNALKNALALVVNGVASLFFIVVADVAWEPAALIAVGAIVGGTLGARVARRINQRVLRSIIVIGGIAIGIRLIVT
ncbi:MAG TPA: sulfite exporter TauE/SafE family protein, partial [Ilumatobacteraceae bacterium]|nr:sulfite exporter TauE/SafE family protein [Ilumatobacteraceae bacterium]